MFLRKSGIGTALAALVAMAGLPGAAQAEPHNWQLGFQEAASPVMEQIESFHMELVYIIVAVCLFVLALLVWVVVRYRASVNPTPSKVHHNTILEIAWTIIPIIILVVIELPSFKLLYLEESRPTPDVKIRAIGKQWFWTYEYPWAFRMMTPRRRTSRACWASTTRSMCRWARSSRSRPQAPT
jgi:cytochrome c oxidase subunit II